MAPGAPLGPLDPDLSTPSTGIVLVGSRAESSSRPWEYSDTLKKTEPATLRKEVYSQGWMELSAWVLTK